MELTNFEKKVMAPGYAKKCRLHYLYLGLAFIVVGVFVLAHGYIRFIPQTDAAWEQSLVVLKKVTPMTSGEQVLFSMALNSLNSAKIGWNGFIEEKTKNISMSFLFVGIYLLGSFFRESRYSKLLAKLSSQKVVRE